MKRAAMLSTIILGTLLAGCNDKPTDSDLDQDNEPEPTTGTVEVTVATTGEDPDPDGYTVMLVESESQQIEPNGTLTFRDVEEGDYQLQLEDLDNKCSVQAENPQTVSVSVQDTTEVSFAVQCENVVLRNKIVTLYGEGNRFDGLYILDSDGANPEKLTDQGGDESPVISPDGTKVAFVSGSRNPEVSDHHMEIYIVDASGYPITHIPRPPESLHDDMPSWSPDGKKLLFVQSTAGSLGRDIVSVNIDGTGRTKITDDDRPGDFWPWYTPDGSKIIFYSVRRPSGGNAQIFMMNSDGTNITQLTNIDFFAGSIALSHDGSMVAFHDDGGQIFVVNADGTNVRSLTDDAGSYAFPSWSPDDTQLIFYNFDATDIFKINVDGSELTNLTNTPGIGESDAHWSPVE